MLSADDLERLIAAKKREIEREKTLLGLSPPPPVHDCKENKENASNTDHQEHSKKVNFKESKVLNEHNANLQTEEQVNTSSDDLEEKIPPDLERYIRRYIGLPVMLKAGEYSPNNPLVRTEHVPGDALLGLGEYERRRNTLRKIRQAQYREYLDQQAKKKQEAKERAERERREREERDRLREERERQLLLERERYSPDRHASVSCGPAYNKVDTGVQVDRVSRPLSVAVQTDDNELYRLSPSPLKSLTQAERELSPRTVEPRAHWDHWEVERRRSHGDFDERTPPIKKTNREKLVSDLRHSYMPSVFDEDVIQWRNMDAERQAAERRRYYRQELEGQILEQQRIREERKCREKMLEQAEMRRLEEQLRMLKMAQEKEVDKQHHIITAMKTNAKEYENQRKELQKEIDIEQQTLFRATSQPLRNLPKRKTMTSQSDTGKLPLYYPEERIFKPIDKDKKPYSFNISENSIFSQNYDVDSYLRKNLNFKSNENYNDNTQESFNEPIKTAESQNSEVFDNRNVIVEKALVHEPKERKFLQNMEKSYQNMEKSHQNLEKSHQSMEKSHQTMEKSYQNLEKSHQTMEKSHQSLEKSHQNMEKSHQNLEKSHQTMEKSHQTMEKSHQNLEKSLQKSTKIQQNAENLSIPLLRHSPKGKPDLTENSSFLSEAMKKVDDKWKVPAVQKNILKSLPSENGKNISILTQLGSIRRQLQLEQLKLDKMLTKNDL